MPLGYIVGKTPSAAAALARAAAWAAEVPASAAEGSRDFKRAWTTGRIDIQARIESTAALLVAAACAELEFVEAGAFVVADEPFTGLGVATARLLVG